MSKTDKKGKYEMKVVKMILALGCLVAAGCMTSPVAFKSQSVPVPPQGYTVMGSDVTGTSEQIWVFGFCAAAQSV